jgi:hypothetical protein
MDMLLIVVFSVLALIVGAWVGELFRGGDK